MHAIVKKSALLPALQVAAGIADRKSTLPILANVHLSTGKDGLRVAATNLQHASFATLPAEATTEGATTVEAKQLAEVVASLPGDQVTLRGEEHHYLTVKAAKVEYKLVGIGAKDYPKLPDAGDAPFQPVRAVGLLDAIQRTLFSSSTDVTRTHLNGIMFDPSGRVVSTDGHRLSLFQAKDPLLKLTEQIIIPRDACGHFVKLLGNYEEVKVALPAASGAGSRYIFVDFGSGGMMLACKLLDAQFPPFEQVIPKDVVRAVAIGRGALLEAARRISIMSSDRTSGIKISFGEDTVTIAADNPDLGDGRETIDCEFRGAPLTIGINARYLIDWLGASGAEAVTIGSVGDLDPLLLTAEGYTGVIMPMRL